MINSKKQVFLGVPKPTTYHFWETSKLQEIITRLGLFRYTKSSASAELFCYASCAKKNGLDAIHDTVHEMARDEARHGKALEGLLNRYFK